MRVHLLRYLCPLWCLAIVPAWASTPPDNAGASDLLLIYPHKQLMAVGGVMRPTSPNEGQMTSPSTGPRPTPQTNPGNIFPSNPATPLQKQTSPTSPSGLPSGSGSGALPEVMTPDKQSPIEPMTIPPGQQQPVPMDQHVVKGTITNDQTGQPGQALSLADALDEALTRNPQAAAVRAQLAIAKAGLAQATVSPNPVFFMDRGFIAEGDERRGPSITWDPPFKIALRMIAAKRLYDQTKIDLMTTLWTFRANIRRTYTEAIIAIETQKTLSDLYEVSNRLLTVSSKRLQAGDVPELDVLRARLAVSQSAVDLAVGERRVVRASQQLNVTLGRAVEAGISVPVLPDFTGARPSAARLKELRRGILPDYNHSVPPLQNFLTMAFNNRLELKSLTQQISVNKANYKNALASIIPNPGVAYGSSTETNVPTGPKLRANFLTLNIASPISNLNQGDLAKYKATGRQLVYQIAAQKNQIIADVSSAYNNLLAAKGKIRVYQEHVLADSAEVARLSRRSYEVGQSDINSTLLAQQANVQIRSQYLDAVTTYQAAYTNLELACGRPLD